MTQARSFLTTRNLVTAGAVALPLLLTWKYSAMLDYAYSLTASGATAKIAEYRVADAARIVAAAADPELFERDYLRKPLDGDAVFADASSRGASSRLVSVRGVESGGVAISCRLNGFAYAAHKEAIDSLKPGAPVHVKGVIGAGTGGETLALADGCTVEPAVSALAVR